MRIEIGYKFIFGFLMVILVSVLITQLVESGIIGFIPTGYFSRFTSASVSIIAGMVIGWLFTRAFTRDFRELSSITELISQGDLTQYINISHRKVFPDETVDLANSINRMLGSLRDLVGLVKRNADSVSESAQSLSASAEEINASTEEIASTIEQISRGAEHQAELVERTSSIIKDIASSIERVAMTAQELSESSGKSQDEAKSANDLVENALERMQGIFGNMESIGKGMLGFSERAKEIGNIIDVISGVAQQTNLLALNATIEAARAGEYGRGFAVVADEIRKLSESTTKFAEEITGIITDIGDGSEEAVSEIREVLKNVQEGRDVINSVMQSLGGIVKIALDSLHDLSKISELSQKQAEGAEEMVKSIDEIARVAEDNAASTEEVSAATEEQTASMEEMASSAQEMSDTSEELKSIVDKFKLEPEV